MRTKGSSEVDWVSSASSAGMLAENRRLETPSDARREFISRHDSGNDARENRKSGVTSAEVVSAEADEAN